MKTLLSFAITLAAVSAFAGIFDQFGGEKSSDIKGDAQIVAVDTVAPAGKQSTPAVGSHFTSGPLGNVLKVDGSATYTNSIQSANSKATADMLFFVEEQGDAPVAADLESQDNVRIGIAAGPAPQSADTNSEIYVYCKTNSGNDWVNTGVQVATGAWSRVTLNFDYENNTCQVCINGIPAVSASGHPTASTAESDGSWYAFANNGSASADVASITFIGSASIDDIYVASTNAVDYSTIKGSEEVAVADVGTIVVSNQYLAAYGLTTGDMASSEPLDASGLKVADKYACGLDPRDGSTFTAKSITSSGSTGTIVIPCEQDNGQTYKVVVESDGERRELTPTSTGNVEGNQRSLQFAIPDDMGKVLKFQIKATAPTAAQ